MDIKRLRDLSGLTEGYTVSDPINTDENPDRSREGLEGPFRLKSGLVVYYDPKEGKYYDAKTDLYLQHDEYQQHNESMEINMNNERMRILAGLENITEAAKAPASKGEPKKYTATYDGKTIEITASDETEAKKKAVSTTGLSVPMTQWGKVSIKLVESVIVEAEDKAPELDTKVEAAGKKVKVPADVTAAINSRIAELKQSIAQDDEKGYNDGSSRENAIEALEQIASDLKLEDGLTVANLFYGTLSSPVTSLLPPKVVKFVNSSLKRVAEAAEKGESGTCDDCGSKHGYRVPGGAFQCEKCFNSTSDDD